MVLVEHKNLGKSLGKAESQAFRYIQDLASGGRTDEAPCYVVLSDFSRIALYDLDSEAAPVEFPRVDFHEHIHKFAFISGYKQHTFEEQDPIKH